jgi:hypothetical protein
MRQLTKKQKNILDKWVNSQVNSEDDKFMTGFTFKQNKFGLDISDLPSEIYAKLEEINDTEILWQEVNRHIEDRATEIIYKS